MIVKMKKAFLLIRHNQAAGALEDLGNLGIMHVEQESISAGSELNEIGEKLLLIEQARSVLSANSPKSTSASTLRKQNDLFSVCRHIIDLQKRYEQLREYSVTLNGLIDFWHPWGDFDPAKIRALREKNVWVKFYQLPENKIKEFPVDIVLQRISSQGSSVNFLTIA
ncbi:MAG: hypothetical protein PHO81_05915, partial [Candidatus Omnitrophica bacterium]|nr:hypothetical protein [Candidatus Omnitrophota bacterium]